MSTKTTDLSQDAVVTLIDSTVKMLDIVRKEVAELDSILKVHTGFGPGVLIELQRINDQLESIEEKLKLVELKHELAISRIVEVADKDLNITDGLNSRIRRLERISWMATGIAGLITFFLAYSDKIISFLQ